MARIPSNGALKAHQRGGHLGTWLALLAVALVLMTGTASEAFKQTEPSSPADDAVSAPRAVAKADSGEFNDGPCDQSWTLCWQRT